MKADLYDRVTAQIISSLESGVRPWFKPWSAGHAEGRITRPLRCNGVPYQGINVLILWGAAMDRGYSSPSWFTFKQALEVGAHVRKGEKGNLVVYASKITRTGTDEQTGEVSERDIPFLKSYTVFNAEQLDGLPAQYLTAPAPRLDPVQRIDQADAFFKATGATIAHGGNQALYNQSADHVQMPPFEAFKDAESY